MELSLRKFTLYNIWPSIYTIIHPHRTMKGEINTPCPPCGNAICIYVSEFHEWHPFSSRRNIDRNSIKHESLSENNPSVAFLSAWYCNKMCCMAGLYNPDPKLILPLSIFCDTDWKYGQKNVFPFPSLDILFISSLLLLSFPAQYHSLLMSPLLSAYFSFLFISRFFNLIPSSV